MKKYNKTYKNMHKIVHNIHKMYKISNKIDRNIRGFLQKDYDQELKSLEYMDHKQDI